MKTKVTVSVMAAIGLVAAINAVYRWGQQSVWKTAFKECHAHLQTLTQWETNRPPELREYLKARYYHLANRVPKEFVGEPRDYGPVDTNVATLAVFKGPSSGQLEYAAYRQRFNLPKPPQ